MYSYVISEARIYFQVVAHLHIVFWCGCPGEFSQLLIAAAIIVVISFVTIIINSILTIIIAIFTINTIMALA